MKSDDGIRWHDPKGEVITLPGCDPSEPPLTTPELIQGEIVRTTYRMKGAAERELTPNVRRALSEDAQRIIEACERYGMCGD